MNLKRALYLWQSKYPWEVRIEKITGALRDAGIAVGVLARQQGEAPQEIVDGVDIHRVGGPFSAPFSGNPVWSKALAQTIRTFQPDLLIVREIPLAWTAVRVARKMKIPVVMDMAEHYPGAMRSWKKYQDGFITRALTSTFRLPDRLEEWAVRRMDGILVVCEEQSIRLQEQYGYPLEKLTLVGNTPKAGWFSDARKGSSRPPRVLGHHGHMTPERGLDLLIEAFAEALGSFPNIELHLAGGGETEGDVARKIRSLGVEKQVKLLGRYTHSDLSRLYGQIDIAVLPYPPSELIEHTLSNKIFDYMACGKPLVTSNAAPMRRILAESGAGVTFEPWTASALAEKIKELLRADQNTLDRMSENGQKACAERYHWEEDAGRMIAGLNRVLSEHRA